MILITVEQWRFWRYASRRGRLRVAFIIGGAGLYRLEVLS